MKFRQMEVFHAYMATGSTIGAAELLNISQPAVSTMLKRIEEEQGITLFKRLRGRLIATPEARALYNQIRTIHDDMAQLDRLIENLAKGYKGSLRVGLVPALSIAALPIALKNFQTKYPEVYLTVEVHNSDELIELLVARRLDIALIFGDYGNMPFESEIIVSTKLVCAVPNPWIVGNLSSIHVRDLARYPIAGLRASDPIGSLFAEAGLDGAVDLRLKIEMRNCGAALALAEAGLAIALIDPFTAYNNVRNFCTILPLEPAKHLPVAICALSDQNLSRAESALRQCLMDAVKQVSQS